MQNGGGVQYTQNGRTYTFQQRNGVMYNVSDLANIPAKVGNGMSGKEMVEKLTKTGRNPTILSKKQMEERVNRRNAERANRPDYELGGGSPWGNKGNRKAARQGRLASRAMRKR